MNGIKFFSILKESMQTAKKNLSSLALIFAAQVLLFELFRFASSFVIGIALISSMPVQKFLSLTMGERGNNFIHSWGGSIFGDFNGLLCVALGLICLIMYFYYATRLQLLSNFYFLKISQSRQKEEIDMRALWQKSAKKFWLNIRINTLIFFLVAAPIILLYLCGCLHSLKYAFDLTYGLDFIEILRFFALPATVLSIITILFSRYTLLIALEENIGAFQALKASIRTTKTCFFSSFSMSMIAFMMYSITTIVAIIMVYTQILSFNTFVALIGLFYLFDSQVLQKYRELEASKNKEIETMS